MLFGIIFESRGYDTYMVDEESLEAYCSIVCGQNKVLGGVNRIALKPWSDSNVILVIGRTARRQTSEDRGGKPPTN